MAWTKHNPSSVIYASERDQGYSQTKPEALYQEVESMGESLTAECSPWERNSEWYPAVTFRKSVLGLILRQKFEYIAATGYFQILAISCSTAYDFQHVAR